MSEIKTLVVDDKWMAHLSASVQSEIDRVSQIARLAASKQLAERYATPLPKLATSRSRILVPEVEKHLESEMGLAWK